MTQPVAADNAEQIFHHNDTVKYARTPAPGDRRFQTQLGTVKAVDTVAGHAILTVLPIGADHTVKVDANDATVVHPAIDLPALTDMLGLPAHEQSAVQAFTGDDYGHKWSLTEAIDVVYLWHDEKG